MNGDTCASYGGRTKTGEPCGRPAGWGAADDTGPCMDHPDAAQTAGNGCADLPQPPAHLSPEAKSIWRDIASTWKLPPDARELVRTAMEQWDVYQEARQVLQEEGPTVTNPDSGNVRRHPAHSVAKDALKGFRMCLKDAGLEPIDQER